MEDKRYAFISGSHDQAAHSLFLFKKINHFNVFVYSLKRMNKLKVIIMHFNISRSSEVKLMQCLGACSSG